jgi:hypothetical protein
VDHQNEENKSFNEYKPEGFVLKRWAGCKMTTVPPSAYSGVNCQLTFDIEIDIIVSVRYE